jgi:hypothetical protein
MQLVVLVKKSGLGTVLGGFSCFLCLRQRFGCGAFAAEVSGLCNCRVAYSFTGRWADSHPSLLTSQVFSGRGLGSVFDSGSGLGFFDGLKRLQTAGFGWGWPKKAPNHAHQTYKP